LTARKAAFIYSSQLDEYRYPSEHPFNTSRAKKARQILKPMGLLDGTGRAEVAPIPVDQRTLEKFHTAEYLDALRQASVGQHNPEALRMGIGTEDCPIFPGLYDYAVLSAGGTLVGARLILSGEADVAFNPSGGYHHAFSDRAAGFCYINDVVLACIELVGRGRKVLFLDIDAHNGDGVADAFENRSAVMTISLHQDPQTVFPYTGFANAIGSGEGEGYCINVPLPIGIYDGAYLKAFRSIVLPLVGVFEPDVVVLEFGADALAGDPLARLSLTNYVYVEVLNHLLEYGKPILMTGGGGYNVDKTARAWALGWTVVCGEYDEHDLHLGVGGVMLESTDWAGGLRDRALAVSEQQRNSVEPVLERTIAAIQTQVFPLHGLRVD
jgi:acetoin utilization protein AcuC